MICVLAVCACLLACLFQKERLCCKMTVNITNENIKDTLIDCFYFAIALCLGTLCAQHCMDGLAMYD